MKSMALSLPDEIWALIVVELELRDVFSARLLCRRMRDICADQMIWWHIFLRSLGLELPEPFFLPKPLNENSARDIESALQTWKYGWTPTLPLQHYNRSVNKDMLEGRLDLETVIITPGGRYAIVASSTGAIWWFNLSDDWTSTATVEPHLLVTSEMSAPEAAAGPIEVKFAIDFLSEESLGPSRTEHHLTQFNIAVITRFAGRPPHPIHVGVWSVSDTGGSLLLRDRLSFYAEAAQKDAVRLADISLYGLTVAYGFK